LLGRPVGRTETGFTGFPRAATQPLVHSTGIGAGKGAENRGARHQERPERPKRDTLTAQTHSAGREQRQPRQAATQEATARAPAPPPGPHRDRKRKKGREAAGQPGGGRDTPPGPQPCSPKKGPTHLAAAQTKHQGGKGCQHDTPTQRHGNTQAPRQDRDRDTQPGARPGHGRQRQRPQPTPQPHSRTKSPKGAAPGWQEQSKGRNPQPSTQAQRRPQRPHRRRRGGRSKPPAAPAGPQHSQVQAQGAGPTGKLGRPAVHLPTTGQVLPPAPP
jgi:hypothetical protein